MLKIIGNALFSVFSVTSNGILYKYTGIKIEVCLYMLSILCTINKSMKYKNEVFRYFQYRLTRITTSSIHLI